jgi:hypothetical protein
MSGGWSSSRTHRGKVIGSVEPVAAALGLQFPEPCRPKAAPRLAVMLFLVEGLIRAASLGIAGSPRPRSRNWRRAGSRAARCPRRRAPLLPLEFQAGEQWGWRNRWRSGGDLAQKRRSRPCRGGSCWVVKIRACSIATPPCVFDLHLELLPGPLMAVRAAPPGWRIPAVADLKPAEIDGSGFFVLATTRPPSPQVASVVEAYRAKMPMSCEGSRARTVITPKLCAIHRLRRGRLVGRPCW